VAPVSIAAVLSTAVPTVHIRLVYSGVNYSVTVRRLCRSKYVSSGFADVVVEH